MKKLDLNNNKDAAIFIWREAVCNKPNAVNYICKFLNPGYFSAWLLRYLQGDKSAQDEAVAAFVASFEKWQDAGGKDEELFDHSLRFLGKEGFTVTCCL
jgi:hypothetical protein